MIILKSQYQTFKAFSKYGKLVFKKLVLSKVVHLCLISVVPKQIIEKIEIIQKNLLLNRSTSKITRFLLGDTIISSKTVAQWQQEGE